LGRQRFFRPPTAKELDIELQYAPLKDFNSVTMSPQKRYDEKLTLPQ
jgi:hypothetical protein